MKQIRRLSALALSLALILSLLPSALAAEAVLSPQKLTVDGKPIECEKYNIGGSNYFKLRDLAYVLSGTASQFAVGYDAASATVSITTGVAYTPNGTELAAGTDNAATAQPSAQTILIDGAERSDLTAYNIGGSNFFQLRELGAALDFSVDYDAGTNTAVVRSGEAVLDGELQSAKTLGLIPGTVPLNSGTVTFSQFGGMLSNVIRRTDPSALDQWNALAAKMLAAEDAMERDDGILALYEAACVLGLGQATAYFYTANPAYVSGNLFAGYSPREDIFANIKSASPFEANIGRVAGVDYATGAQNYAMGSSSAINPAPFFAHPGSGVSYSSPLTAQEAIRAAYRLYLSWVAGHEGSFDITDYETDWSDSLLADAAAARTAILNSPTAIAKGGAYVQGETYSGTAYYVSNSGKDTNDGKSPETAWATLSKVSSAKLSHGDAVFFERGGVWSTADTPLIMQAGVTYSAYGQGPKPVWSGSPTGAADPGKWTFYKQTADGGKIWKYADKLRECGVILLNGTVVARKAYQAWDGTKYLRSDGTGAFSVETGLTADLMFFSEVDLKGMRPGEVIEARPDLTGPLYLRCDAGNPGEVFDSIELGVANNSIDVASYNTVDNISYRCFAVSGADVQCNSHIVFQNCEVSWCGGAVKEYVPESDRIAISVSGGGMLLFGTDVTARGNYIHDCESKGIAIVSDSGHAEKDRMNILVEGNVVERCGGAVAMSVFSDGSYKFENVTCRDNHFVNSGYGWRAHSQIWQNSGFGSLGVQCSTVFINNLLSTGEVLLEDNLFYRSAGPLVWYYANDFSAGTNNLPTMRGNTYVQGAGQTLFYQRDERETTKRSALANDTAQARACVQNAIGDITGTFYSK